MAHSPPPPNVVGLLDAAVDAINGTLYVGLLDAAVDAINDTLSEELSDSLSLIDAAQEAAMQRNVSAFAEAYDDASLVARLAFLAAAACLVPCMLSTLCNVLSCTILLPLYVTFVGVHEPTLLGLDEPRSDSDGLAPTHESDRARAEAMLRRRAEAGERLGRRLMALLQCRPYTQVAVA